ncbi:hypothetical protein EPUL_003120, partial [Erysiphe pulchra]
MDNEALKESFKETIINRGIITLTSPPYTPQPNGVAECAGGVIMARTRAIALGANLPQELWPELSLFAIYILNHTPRLKLENQTLFQKLFGRKPDISYFRIPGSRAYVHIKTLPKREKLISLTYGALPGRNGQAYDRIRSSATFYLAKDLYSSISKVSSRILHIPADASSLSSCETTPRPRQKFFYNIAASYVAKHHKFISDQNSYDFKKDNTDISYLKSLTRQQHQKLYKDDRPKTGQDAFFVSRVGQTQDVVMGVADGVGGWADVNVDPADFSHGLCYYMKYAASIYEKEEWGGSDLHAQSLIRRGFDDLCKDNSVKAGSSTACVAVAKDNGVLDVANLGDSGYVLIRLNDVHSYSTPQTHAFNTPFQLAIIPLQDEYQSAVYGTPYLQDAPEKADITQKNLEHGDVFIIGSDGLWDNLFNSDILEIVSQAMLRAQAWKYSSSKGFSVGKNLAATLSSPDRSRRSKLESLHRTIATRITAEANAASTNKLRESPFSQEVHMAYPNNGYNGGKIDDICVIVAIVCEE